MPPPPGRGPQVPRVRGRPAHLGPHHPHQRGGHPRLPPHQGAAAAHELQGTHLA